MRFKIHSYTRDDDEITFWNEDQTKGARCSIDDIIDKHPGITEYVGFHNDPSEADTPHHTSAYMLFENGSDDGNPITMACKVWDEIDKYWVDGDERPLNRELRAIEECGYAIESVHGNLVTAWFDGIGKSEPDVFAALPRLLYLETGYGNSVKLIFEISE